MFSFELDEDTLLRDIRREDAEELFRITDASRDYLRDWLPWVDATAAIDDTKGFIDSCVRDYEDHRSLTAAIIHKGQIAGLASYHLINRANRSVSIGYWLGEAYQGKGLMTKAVTALVDYAFTELHVNRVEIRAASENKKSRAIPERLHFVHEGTVRQAEFLYDHFVDHEIYGMLAEDWGKLS